MIVGQPHAAIKSLNRVGLSKNEYCADSLEKL